LILNLQLKDFVIILLSYLLINLILITSNFTFYDHFMFQILLIDLIEMIILLCKNQNPDPTRPDPTRPDPTRPLISTVLLDSIRHAANGRMAVMYAFFWALFFRDLIFQLSILDGVNADLVSADVLCMGYNGDELMWVACVTLSCLVWLKGEGRGLWIDFLCFS
jgi:hypothetical protein